MHFIKFIKILNIFIIQYISLHEKSDIDTLKIHSATELKSLVTTKEL